MSYILDLLVSLLTNNLFRLIPLILHTEIGLVLYLLYKARPILGQTCTKYLTNQVNQPR